jgi:diguanylate cyclase (GGDEF)-like protein/PAS domain S-box-containing protein
MDESRPVRILVIEDEAVTARLLKDKLEKEGYAVDCAADSEEGIAKAISENYDLLAVDYSLPGPNGLDVIRRLGSKGIFPPIVMVTGKGDERIAVEAMKLGAKDYIVKDDDGRYIGLLVRVVERLLAERDLLEETLSPIKAPTETRARYQALFEDTPIGLYRTAPGGQFIDANPALLQMLAVPDRKTILTMNALDFYKDPGDRNRWRDLVEQKGTVNGYELEAIRFDGASIWLEDSSRVIRDSRGKIIYYEGSLQNISERKKKEEEFRRMLMANSVIAELSKTLLTPGSIESIAQLVLEKAKSLTGSRLGYVSYVDPVTGHHICAAATREMAANFDIRKNEDLSGKTMGLWKWPLETKRPLMTNAGGEDPRFGGRRGGRTAVDRFLSVPVLLGDRLVGQITVINANRDYTELDLGVISSLASAYAVALERLWADEVVVKARDFYITVLEEFPTLIWRSGIDGRFDYFNKTWLGFTGRSLQQELGEGWTEGIHADDAKRTKITYENAFQARKSFEAEFRLRRYDGVYRRVLNSGRPFFDLEGKFAGFVGTCLDITEQKEVEDTLRKMSQHDGLTRLYNRSFFEAELERLAGARNPLLTILMLDVDGLKGVNDTLGHAEGDKLLLRVAEVLGVAFRPEDVVARVGGDEFAVILPGVDEIVARDVVDRLRRRLEEHNRSFPDRPLQWSLGVATRRQGVPVARILRDADERMYEEKASKASTTQNGG